MLSKLVAFVVVAIARANVLILPRNHVPNQHHLHRFQLAILRVALLLVRMNVLGVGSGLYRDDILVRTLQSILTGVGGTGGTAAGAGLLPTTLAVRVVVGSLEKLHENLNRHHLLHLHVHLQLLLPVQQDHHQQLLQSIIWWMFWLYIPQKP